MVIFVEFLTNIADFWFKKAYSLINLGFFQIDDEHVLLGTYSGDLHWYNIRSGQDEARYECHHSALTSAQQSKDGSLLLTSSAFVKPLSILWRVTETQDHLIDFTDEYFVEFSNYSADRIIGTQGPRATVRRVQERNIVILGQKQAYFGKKIFLFDLKKLILGFISPNFAPNHQFST